MKRTKKETENAVNKKTKNKAEPKSKNPAVEQIEDVKKLVHLLQVHQVELEHQNEELRLTQAELEISRNKYVNLFDFSPIPYFTLDTDGIIREVNLSASKMFALDRKKIIGKRFSSFVYIDEKDIFNSFIKKVFNSSIKHSCELKVVSKDKIVFKVLLEGLKFDDTLEINQLCQVALIDLTKYKQVEDSLIKTTEKLKLLNATKDKIFSIIAHDLRSPFQSLLSSSEILATEIKKLSQEEISSLSEGLNVNLKFLYSLLENLLNWSLMKRNLLEFKPVNLKLDEMVNSIIDISNQRAVKKNISIINTVDAGTLVYADVDMLHSIIQNLIINAIKFTFTNGQIIISSIEKPGWVEVSVQDNGIGFEPEKSSDLFDFNAIFTTNGTAGEKGTGLGLPLCKEFVEKLGGKIWVESEIEKGTKFTFTIPGTSQ